MVLRELLINLGVQTKGLQKADSGIKRLATGLKTLAASTGLVVVARQVSQLVDQTSQSVDTLAKTARKLGVGAQALGELRFAAERTGVSTRTLDLAMQRFIRRAAEASQGTGEAKKAFQELGISQQELATTSPEDLLARVADGLQAAGDSGTQLRLAFKFFDSEGAALVNTLKGGSGELNKLRARFRELGVDLSGDTTQAMQDYRDMVLEAETASQGMRIELTKFLLPLFIALTKAVTKTSQAFGKIAQDTKLLQATAAFLTVILGGLAAQYAATAIAAKIAAAGSLSAWLASLAPFLLIVALGAVIIGIFEDIFVTLEGGDSLGRRFSNTISELFDNLMAFRSTNPIIDGLVASFQTWAGSLAFIKDSIFGVIEAINGGDLKQIGATLKASFQDNVLSPAKRSFAGQLVQGAANLFGGSEGGAGAAARAQLATSASRTAGNTTNSSRTNNNQVSIQIDGAQSPEATAKAVTEALDSRLGREFSNAQLATTPNF